MVGRIVVEVVDNTVAVVEDNKVAVGLDLKLVKNIAN